MTVRPRMFLAVVAAFLLFPSLASAQALVWDPNEEADLAGYRVWYGTQSRAYTDSVDVGMETTFDLSSLTAANTYYLAVQAYTSRGVVSAFSTEVAYTPARTIITMLQASTAAPFAMGRAVTWTAQATNTAGPVEYRFWINGRNGWRIARDYSPINSFTWVPGWDDQGPGYVQVWVRRAGATAVYEAYRASEPFTVASAALSLRASVDFPTPAGNPVTWTATVAGAGSTPLEYRFWVLDRSTAQWSMLRDYTDSNQAVWTPAAGGRYVIQVWARRVGSSQQYDLYLPSPDVQISRAPLEVTMSSSERFPASTGERLTWTARPRGGMAGPLEYQFWRFSRRTGWTIVQPFGSNQSYSWTPTWGDAGVHAIQVWVKNAGSNEAYDAYASSGLFTINRAALHLTSSTSFPAAPGTTVEWEADAPGSDESLQYQFWVFSQATGAWSIAQPYSSDRTFTWSPAAGTYAVQVWARMPGSTDAYDEWRTSGFIRVASAPVVVESLMADRQLPASASAPITWTARASGGTDGPLRYQFWMWDQASGTWNIVQPYSTNPTFTWTPSPSDAGTYALQVWVRSVNSSANYQGWMSSGYFVLQP